MDYTKFYSVVAKRRKPSALRELHKRFTVDDESYPLSGGVPTPDIFNFKDANFIRKDGSIMQLGEELMAVGQQYGVSDGYAPLIQKLREFQTKLHNPPMKDWSIAITGGCQEALSKVFELVVSEGDWVVGGDYCFSGSLEIFMPIGANYLAVEQDKFGIRPESLRSVLKGWYDTHDPIISKGIPKILYIVPNGGNPEARTIPNERRKEIYKVAQDYDLLILEDDPYQFIVFDQDIPVSFLSLDVDGRVLRCDSISKTICPGFRLGYVTAARPLIDKIVHHIQTSVQQSSCLTQVVVLKMFMEWGLEGYLKNAKKSCQKFKEQRDLMVFYVKKWLSDLGDFDIPTGGMFLWIKIRNVEDTADICDVAAKRKAFFAPGSIFRPESGNSPYIRISFSDVDKDLLDNGLRILAGAIREATGMVNGKTPSG